MQTCVVVAFLLGMQSVAAQERIKQESAQPSGASPNLHVPARIAAGDVSSATAADAAIVRASIRVALESAEDNLDKGQVDQAVDMAWAGLRAIQKLPDSENKQLLSEPFLQLLVDAKARKSAKTPALQEAGATKQPQRAEHKSSASQPNVDGALKRHFPDYEPFSEKEAHVRDEARLKFEADLARSYKSDEADVLARTGQARRLPQDHVAYPPDWKKRSTRSRQGSQSVLYKGEPFQDVDGEVRQTVVYDIQSLTMSPPRFHYIPSYDLHTTMRKQLDRDALRRGSEIFNGFPHDLAAGLPLLDYFNGTGDWPATFESDDRQYQELLRMIEQISDEPVTP